MDVTLTTRGKHLEMDIPMCGIPHVKLDQYLIKLVKAGHNVAICEQIESVNQAKKRGYKSIVKRDVTRIITPGTLIEEGHLESPSPFIFHPSFILSKSLHIKAIQPFKRKLG